MEPRCSAFTFLFSRMASSLLWSSRQVRYACFFNWGFLNSHCLNIPTWQLVHSIGKVGITLNIDWKEPKTKTPDDVKAANRSLQFMIGWFAHAIYKNGNYPQVMIDQVAKKSKAQGLPKSRLPVFTAEEQKYIMRKCVLLAGMNGMTVSVYNDRPNCLCCPQLRGQFFCACEDNSQSMMLARSQCQPKGTWTGLWVFVYDQYD